MTFARVRRIGLLIGAWCSLVVASWAGVAQAGEKVRAITFDDIKFQMRKGAPFRRSMLTKAIEQLDGKQIKIRGYILPGFQQKGITQFVLVRDNMECCFGPGAALYDCVLVEMQSGKSTSFTVRPVAVTGRFAIDEFKDPDGKHLAIYRMTGQEVR
jgi:hypothetical protein